LALTDAIAAYEDCDKLFDQALAKPKGIRVCLGAGEDAKKAAHYLRMRMNHYRQLQRRESMKVYDKLYVRLAEDEASEWWLYIDPAGQEALIVAIEDIE